MELTSKSPPEQEPFSLLNTNCEQQTIHNP